MKVILDLSRFKKQIIAALVDALLLPMVFLIGMWMRYDALNMEIIARYTGVLIAIPFVSIPLFIKIGLYRAVIRFIDQKIVYAVVIAVTLSTVLLVSVAVLLTHMNGLSRGVFGIYWVTAIAYMVTSRFVARGFLLQKIDIKGAKRVAIYGAGQAGIQLASALHVNHEYVLVAFIDEKRELRGASIAGTRVYSPDELSNVIKKHGIDEILLAMPSLTKAQQKRILDQLEPLKVKTKVTPAIATLFSGDFRVQDIRDIGIEDLLGRDAVSPDFKLISSCIADKVVLVSGAGGSIGSELTRQILPLKPARLLLLEISEFALYSIEQELLSIQRNMGIKVELIAVLGSAADQAKCEKLMRIFGVNTVYHAAAYKHVPLVEHNPIEGVRNNVFGTLNIAYAALSAEVETFVLISTDKAVRPTNTMGATKRLAELILQAFARRQSRTRFCMVRFGNVLGSSGSVVPLFRKQILQGGPITVTHPEITRYFMTIPEAAQLVLQAGSMSTGGDVFVLDMGDPVKIVDLAKRMVHLSGLEVLSDETPNGTIEIQHVGLRPGEKLYEELLIGANAEGTEHPLIMRAQEYEIPWQVLNAALNDLDAACCRFDVEKVREILIKTVAEYVPQCDIQDYTWLEEYKANQTYRGSIAS